MAESKELDALVAQLLPQLKEALLADSTAAGEIEAVANLEGIKALAAYLRVGGTERVVEVPLSLLKGEQGDPLTWEDLTPDQRIAINNVVPISERGYQQLVAEGRDDDSKFYFTFEDE